MDDNLDVYFLLEFLLNFHQNFAYLSVLFLDDFFQNKTFIINKVKINISHHLKLLQITQRIHISMLKTLHLDIYFIF